MFGAMGDVFLVGGSPSAGSRSSSLLQLVASWLGEAGLRTELLSVRELPAEALLRGDASAEGIREGVAALAGCRAVVVATPIYKAAYSGLLKTWLDLLPQFALTEKVVLPLATGGSAAHVLAIDYALRPVLSSLGARHIVPGYFVVESNAKHNENGDLELTPETNAALGRVVADFVSALR
jgi:FMN reductase